MKVVFLSLIIMSNCFIPNAFGNEADIKIPSLLDGLELSNNKNDKAQSVDLNISTTIQFDTPYDKKEFERTESGTTDAIKLGLTPEWVEFNTYEGRKRMRYDSINIKKSNKKNS